jgi:predicted DCC family thiol-disulfide oxidoreductase YuxK
VAVVLFDGVCNLCNGIVRFVIERDPHARFQFAALSSDAGARALAAASAPQVLPDSLVVIEDDGRVFMRSDAVLRVGRRLRFPWPLAAYAAAVVPRVIRDWIYDQVARRRYQWFGRREACMAPAPRLRDRFLS